MLRLLVSVSIISIVCSGAYAAENAPLCVVNSEPKPCGKLCEPTCAKPKEILCNPVNPEACKIECRCLKGFVRNPKTNQCIKVSDCPKKCRANSSLKICGTLCEPSCTVPKPKNCPRIECTKSTQGCRCNSGYLRDKRSGKCVLPAACKR